VLRFGLDLVDAIEQNHTDSCAISRILRLRIGERQPENEMHKCDTYFMTESKQEVEIP